MPKQCPVCEQVYPDFVDFCVADGNRLERSHSDDEDGVIAYEEPVTAEMTDVPLDEGFVAGRARLFPRVRGEIQPYGLEFFGDVVLGRFEPEVGAVDVDLSDMPGAEFIEPRHAMLSYADGAWTVDDLDTDNGTFVNRGSRIDGPTMIESGQELALGNALFVFETDLPPRANAASSDDVPAPMSAVAADEDAEQPREDDTAETPGELSD